jgi:3-methylcrotonyl-CoA carboxylase alpha subunit
MSLIDGFQHIHKVLIANRGEIACRIIKSCKQLGLISVAIYSKADRSSSHVRLADEAWLLPGADQTAYIEEDAVLDIARKSGAHAVIPGYGELALLRSKRRMSGFS